VKSIQQTPKIKNAPDKSAEKSAASPRPRARKASFRRDDYVGPLSKNLIEIFPQTLSVTSSVSRPVLIFKDKSGQEVLPVWVDAVDAGVLLADMSNSASGSPHTASLKAMEMMGWEPKTACIFELVGHHQFVLIEFYNPDAVGPRVNHIRVRASDAMSFCIQARVKFLSTKSFMEECRTLDGDIVRLENSLMAGHVSGFQANDEGGLEISSKKSPYMM
jgi:hypothetical protein